MDKQKIYDKLDKVLENLLDLSNFIEITKDSCQSQNYYAQEYVLELALQKYEDISEKIENIMLLLAR